MSNVERGRVAAAPLCALLLRLRGQAEMGCALTLTRRHGPLQLCHLVSLSAMSRSTHNKQQASQLWTVGPGMGERYCRVATAILKYRQKPPITLQLDQRPVTDEDFRKLHCEIETMFKLYDTVQGVFVHDGLWRQIGNGLTGERQRSLLW